MAQTLLVRNGTIITLGRENRVLSGHAVLVEDGSIRQVAPAGEFSGCYDQVIDAAGKVVMPGLINAHMHFYSTLVRGLGKAQPSKDFNEVLQHLWWRLDRVLCLEDCYVSAKLMLLEAIRKGTTTLIDHHASPGAVTGSLAEIARAVEESGLRACLCYEVSDRDGEEITRQGLEENKNFIQRCLDRPSPFLKALLGMHAAFTISEETMSTAAWLGRAAGVGFHLHVAEAQSDQDYNLKYYGRRVVQRLHDHGLLGPSTIAAHCVHLDERERQLLQETGTMVVHNPQSNLNNAVGIADVLGMARQGILVGLGTDAMTVNMLEEIRVALWAQHLRQNNPSAAFMEVAGTLFFNNPVIASRIWGLPLGAIEPGAAADLILVDYDPPTPLDAMTVLGHLIFGISQARVDTTIVGGRVLMANKALTIDVDEAALAARSRELAAELWARF